MKEKAKIQTEVVNNGYKRQLLELNAQIPYLWETETDPVGLERHPDVPELADAMSHHQAMHGGSALERKEETQT